MLSNKLIKNILKNEFFLKGSIFERYVKCSRKGCKCSKGMLHGPYYYFSFLYKGKIIQVYIKKSKLKKVKEGIRNYERFQKLITEETIKNIKKIKKGGKNVKSKRVKRRREVKDELFIREERDKRRV